MLVQPNRHDTEPERSSRDGSGVVNRPPSPLNMLLSRHTRRREFIAVLGGAAAWPLAARAQQSGHMRRVGVMMGTVDDVEGQARAALLRQGFSELGWTDGRNIHIDYRWVGGDAAKAKANAAELVSQKPDVIIANTTLSLAAVRNQTSTIPIVFVAIGDPIGQGFVSSLAHPGGNITGFTAFEFATSAKWLELLKEIVPALSRIAFIFNPEAAPFAEKFVNSIKRVAPSLGVELMVSPTRDAAEIDHALVAVSGEPKGGLIVEPDAFTTGSAPPFTSNLSLPVLRGRWWVAVLWA
jgi:putative tryptophan/tyrosine transport system substrate-binding protein